MTVPESLLEGLNPPQQDAVSHGVGPLLVVAGAGTGKTRVITRRVAALVAGGVDPHAILAITFTNKAAAEMRERVEDLIGPSGVTLCTYHSFCARFLRTHADRIGFTGDYTIYDRDDSLALVNRLIKDSGRDKGSIEARQIIDVISAWKQEGLGPREAIDSSVAERDREIAEFYGAIDTRMRLANALDFDDLLMKTVALLREDAEIGEQTAGRYRHLLIDEYQDTNRIQYEIVRLIGSHGNVCATGDPDQSIYAWRGADIRNILEFERDFPNAKVVLLEENYRSTGCILKAASAVIRNNSRRKERDLWTAKDDGAPLKLVVCDDEKTEATEIASRLEASRDSGREWNQHAVFYRTNAQTRVLERKLRERGIPYRLVGALSFFKRREVKDLLAYLTLLVNPADDQAFLRVVNVPKRGVGKTSVDRIIAAARQRGLPLYAMIGDLDAVEGLTARARRPLSDFHRLLQDQAGLRDGSIRDLLMRIIEETGFEASLEAEPDGSERLENVKELVTAAREFDLADPERGLSEFLADVSLLSSTELEEGDARGVTLMTVHSAKGLEYDHVYICGMEEDLLPHVRSIGDPAAVEEERRLVYVAITRARETLTLLRAESRSQWGQTRWARASRFLAEIPEMVLEVEDKSSSSSFEAGASGGWGARSSRPMAETTDLEGGGDPWSDADFAQDVEEWEPPVTVGERVRHTRFGVGQVLTVSGRPPAVKVRIKFMTVGVRQLIWEKAPLEKA